MNKLEQLKERAFQRREVREEYDALADEFRMIDTLLHMRKAADLTQDELAQRMGTQKSNICRLETGNSNPSWKTLKKYAQACGFKISMAVHEP